VIRQKKWWMASAPDWYPEIGFERTLSRVILEIISSCGREITLNDESKGVFSARFRKIRRLAIVHTGDAERIFIANFSLRGVDMAHRMTSDLHEVARAIESWLLDELTLQEMKQRFPNLDISEIAFETEACRGVEALWSSLLSHADETNATSWLGPDFRVLVRAAAHRPLLRQLVPVVSIGMYLSFSRTIGYPFAMAADCSVAAGNGRCGLVGQGNLLAEGTVEEMLDMIERSIPQDIGPAIFGTAADLID
jgi:Family of unknown function (DUF6193)